MKVVVFGAAGGIGTWAAQHALNNGHHVTAYVRNPEKMKLSGERLTIVKGEINDKNRMVEVLRGQDAVIWCVGIPLKRKYSGMRSLAGHKLLVQAMDECGVKRLIDWGTPSIHCKQDKKSFVTVVPGILASIAFPQAKQEMVAIGQLLEASDLDWTIVRYMAPKDTPYTGKVKVGFGDAKMKFSISREDIGAFMAEQLESPRFIRSMPIIGS